MTLTRAAGGLIAVGCLGAAVLASFALGAVSVPVGDVVAFLTGGDPVTAAILAARVDRTLVGVVCGAALALSGAILQGVTRNPLADPGLLGINAGAALAIALGVVFLGCAIVVLGGQSASIDGLCGESMFLASDCEFNGLGTSLRCRM